MRSGFISIHGIDGTGKSTTVTKLVQQLSERGVAAYDFATTIDPATAFSDIKLGSDLPPEAELFKSLGTKSIQGARVAQKTQLGMTIVKDRWVIDVLASNAYRGALVPQETGILKPDVSVVLTCDEQVRQTRIQRRPDPTPDDLIPNLPGTRAHFFETFLLENVGKMAGHALILDTTELKPVEVAELIAKSVIGYE